jgi:hypothetical protein
MIAIDVMECSKSYSALITVWITYRSLQNDLHSFHPLTSPGRSIGQVFLVCRWVSYRCLRRILGKVAQVRSDEKLEILQAFTASPLQFSPCCIVPFVYIYIYTHICVYVYI